MTVTRSTRRHKVSPPNLRQMIEWINAVRGLLLAAAALLTAVTTLVVTLLKL